MVNSFSNISLRTNKNYQVYQSFSVSFNDSRKCINLRLLRAQFLDISDKPPTACNSSVGVIPSSSRIFIQKSQI